MSTPPSSVSTRIKTQLKKKVSALDAVQQVYGYEEVNPTGWPAVFITPSDLDGEFSSNAENSRVYAFQLLALFPTGQDFVQGSEAERLEYAEAVVASVIDEIVNTMDTDFELPNSDPTVLFMNAADSSWGTYAYEGGVAKAAQITLRVYTELTVQ
jgi:hypothetical protein